ncbi:serine/threonine-protein kinase [Streptomyces sp. NEAU-YJ-81]|uniref:serine/threonine-protein kinase n=1 Tax=Streptomyces sp. NEAU-YJ-81 TaxID=2820288 RepID=UPI001ABCFA05|nr:serine/threonine-protein kinase [Streptomyces sp. NEAU-YJ-81]MBO3674767.1 protein kinase [Streptomyces sp. NEAU-YJ-81]
MTSGGDDMRLIAGRYQLGDRLGRGGMGTVWRAYDQMLAREVAAKELHVASDDHEHHRRLRRAQREARTVARLRHPHVVGVHDLVEHDDRLWIVMELIDGPSLARRIADSGPLPPRHTAALGLQLLGALEAVHAAGALHRDIKPANILLRGDGSAVLTDFGIAALEDDESLTTTGELIGSIGYMAPERLTAEEAGPPSDLWSLGATLSAVASGVPPFQRPTGAAALHAVTFADPVIPERVGPLRPIVQALLNKSPAQRPSAATLRTALQRVADGADDPGPLPPAAPAGPVRTPGPVPTPGPVRTPGGDADTPADLADTPTMTATPTMSATSTAGAPHTVTGTPTLDRDPTLISAPTRTPDLDRDPTLVAPAGPPPPRSRGRARTWWWTAGATLAVAGLATALFFTFGPPSDSEDDASPTPVTSTAKVTVDAARGWQSATNTPVRKGDKVSVRYTTGTWTVDAANLPLVGPVGHTRVDDEALRFAWQDCKVNSDAPFGALLGRYPGNPRNPHAVGRAWHFQATRQGTLQLRINDGEGCLHDNRGAITVTVQITR